MKMSCSRQISVLFKDSQSRNGAVKVFLYSFLETITNFFQLAFKKPSLGQIDVKFTPVIGFGLKFVLI